MYDAWSTRGVALNNACQFKFSFTSPDVELTFQYFGFSRDSVVFLSRVCEVCWVDLSNSAIRYMIHGYGIHGSNSNINNKYKIKTFVLAELNEFIRQRIEKLRCLR